MRCRKINHMDGEMGFYGGGDEIKKHMGGGRVEIQGYIWMVR